MLKINRLAPTTVVIAAILVGLVSMSAQARKSSGKPAPWKGSDLQGLPCRGSLIPFGPFDYLDRDKFPGELFITEEYHLTPEILKLQQATTTTAINDIQYTLMAWPNHHKALFAAYQFRLLNRGEFPQYIAAPSPVECHLQRAINFSPEDPVPYMIQGMLLHEWERYADALKSYRRATKLMPDDIITLYNMGLTLVELEMYDEAREVAGQVYSTDFPLPGLKNKLIAAEQKSNTSTDGEAGKKDTA
ncbi:MAG: tetratricopeptide repeat protein, partial [Halioglobus sp.]|nr:tetratricopeptide repeat protein [Halioglobus sp.]